MKRKTHSGTPVPSFGGSGVGQSLHAAAAVLFLLGGCAPALDWRSVPVTGTELIAELPCRPGRFERDIVVAGTPLKLFMLSCEAGGVTYGVATADVGDPTRVDGVLRALADGSAAAIRSSSSRRSALTIPGATPFSGNVSARLHGERPDGAVVEESMRTFGRGARVFQASAIGPALADAAVKPFEDGLRFDLEKRIADPN
jgi:hypothetical protein